MDFYAGTYFFSGEGADGSGARERAGGSVDPHRIQINIKIKI